MPTGRKRRGGGHCGNPKHQALVEIVSKSAAGLCGEFPHMFLRQRELGSYIGRVGEKCRVVYVNRQRLQRPEEAGEFCISEVRIRRGLPGYVTGGVRLP